MTYSRFFSRNYHTGRLRCLALSFLCLLVVACSNPSQEVLRFGLKSNPITLDPRFATDAASTRINRLLYRQMVDFDEGFSAVPSIATWERPAPSQFVFTLGEVGRVFHDGSRMTASDVEATYQFVLDESNASPHRGAIKHIDSIRVLDENRIEFNLSRPDPLFPGLLVIGIVPKVLADSGHDFARDPVGSGPFTLTEWPNDTRLVLQRQADQQIIEFLRVPKPTVRVLKLLRGEIDLMQNDLLPELVDWVQKRPGYNVEQRAGTNFAYLGFNMEDEVVGDPLVRRAIAHGIDRRAIIKYLMRATARPANAILPPEHWAGNADLVSLEHNPDRARALLKQAGYGADNPLKVVYKTSTDPLRVRIATVIQDQLSQVSIDVELQTFDWGTFYGDIKAGRFQMYSLAWVGIKLPDIFRYTMHSDSLPNAGANRGRFINAQADSLIERAEIAQTQDEQARLYQELQLLLLEELPYVPLWYEDHYLVARKDIEGYTMASDGNYDGLITTHRVATW